MTLVTALIVFALKLFLFFLFSPYFLFATIKRWGDHAPPGSPRWRRPWKCISNSFLPTTKNAVISPDFLVWKFCGKAQLPHSLGRIARNYAETVPFPQNFHIRKSGEIKVFFAVTCLEGTSTFITSIFSSAADM